MDGIAANELLLQLFILSENSRIFKNDKLIFSYL